MERKTARRMERGTGPRTVRKPCPRAGVARRKRDEGGAMRSAEGRGRKLDEAVDAALVELGGSRRNVDRKGLSEGAEETLVEGPVITHASPRAGATAAG